MQFLCDELKAWVAIDHDGLGYALGQRPDVDITWPATIQSLKASLIAGCSDMSPELQAFVDCFDLPRQPAAKLV